MMGPQTPEWTDQNENYYWHN